MGSHRQAPGQRLGRGVPGKQIFSSASLGLPVPRSARTRSSVARAYGVLRAVRYPGRDPPFK